MGYRVSRAEIIELTDAEGVFFQPRSEAFTTATHNQWALADSFDPQAKTASGEWWLRFRAFAIRLDDGRVILVDAGIGPAHAPAASWAPVPGHLPASLEAAGINPADVGQVVLTHLHTDHVGPHRPFPQRRHPRAARRTRLVDPEPPPGAARPPRRRLHPRRGH